jgi:hypothetical protein
MVFHPECALFVTGEIPGGITKTGSAGGQRIELSGFAISAEILECISSKVFSNNILPLKFSEARGSGRLAQSAQR